LSDPPSGVGDGFRLERAINRVATAATARMPATAHIHMGIAGPVIEVACPVGLVAGFEALVVVADEAAEVSVALVVAGVDVVIDGAVPALPNAWYTGPASTSPLTTTVIR
jgi:hypothetical protein